MFFRKLTYCALFAAVVLFSACNREYRNIMRSHDTMARYEFALRMIEEGNDRRALRILEDIQPFMRGRAEFGDLTFTMAQVYFRSRDYFMAAHVYQNYARSFPTSERAEEAFFMAAYSMMMDVPYYKLDQTSAHNAIRQFQLFINYFSHSPRVREANEHIDMLRLQLARKDFAIATHYYRRSLYLAASIAFRNVMRDFPETRFREEAHYMMVKSLFYYAHHSIRPRQFERFTNTLEAHQHFERTFPESRFLSRLQPYKTRTNNFLERNQPPA
ncbi:MAG: outer membrane protein assembly factor BamD [Bacteroidales bacterium]|nr:outer membrane protein assembly factor BamD [Bacteroidales bacterium]